jgi:hypothetical protein
MISPLRRYHHQGQINSAITLEKAATSTTMFRGRSRGQGLLSPLTKIELHPGTMAVSRLLIDYLSDVLVMGS